MWTPVVPIPCFVWMTMAAGSVVIQGDTVPGVPKITPFNFRPQVFVGDKVMVSCLAVGEGPFTFTWEKDGVALTDGSQVKIKDAQDFSGLVINHVQPNNRGNYTCFVRSSLGSDSYTASLFVAAPPTWEIEPSDTKSIVGTLLSLSCRANGSPQPNVHWRKLSGNLTSVARPSAESLHVSPNGTLQFSRLQEDDAGLYECEVDNGIPPGLKKNVSVLVYVVPFSGKVWRC